MRRRPVCIAAVFLVAVLMLGKLLGAQDGAPPDMREAGENVFSGRARVIGTVRSRETTDSGIRLYLNHFIVQKCSSDTSQISEKTSIDHATLKTDFYSEDKGEDSGGYQMMVYLEGEQTAAVGSRVLLEGDLKSLGSAGNPGQFDSASYYLPRKVLCTLQEGEILMEAEQKGSLVRLLSGIRQRLQTSYQKVLGEKQAGTIAAITLGDRSGLPREIKEIYQEGGIAHVLAISSLHITLLGRGLYRLLRRLRLSFLLSGILSGFLIVSFCLMTGMSVSAQRACLMYGLWLGSQIFGRTNDGLTSLSLAATVVLLTSPEYLWDGSFLLSFGCVLSLHFLTPLCERLFPLPGKVGASFQSSLAVTLGTMPVVMYFFYQITPYGVLVNLAVLPCMSLLMVSGLAGGIIGCISVPLGTVAASPCHYLLELFEALCRFERKLPGAVVITGRPGMGQIVLFYLLLALVWFLTIKGDALDEKWKSVQHSLKQGRRRGKKSVGVRRRLAGLGLLAGAMLAVFWRPLPGLRIVCLDVGQGDGILVQAGSFACLIDGGSSSVKGVWQYRMEGALKYYGISRLNAVFLSHGDSDHVNGIVELLESYERNFLGNNGGGITLDQVVVADTGYEEEHLEQITALAREQQIPVKRITGGGSLTSGKLRLTCLHPTKERATGDSNEDSMVLLLEYGQIRALFTGDLEAKGEQRLLEELQDQPPELTLLKVGHHGSKNGTSRKLLEAFCPQIGVISCGENNRYGHPAEEVLERLKEAGVQVYRTDRDGAVILEVRGDTLKAGTWR